MTHIGLISDTHGFLDEAVFNHFQNCDEIWHAGDFGSPDIGEKLSGLMKQPSNFRGVYGNVDGYNVRSIYPEIQLFDCEQVKIFMTHIGGHPQRYAAGIKKQLIDSRVKLFICGHSHILKIIYDDQINCLHINPGAAGKQGWHKMRTIVRFSIDGSNIKNCEVVELGKRF